VKDVKWISPVSSSSSLIRQHLPQPSHSDSHSAGVISAKDFSRQKRLARHLVYPSGTHAPAGHRPGRICQSDLRRRRNPAFPTGRTGAQPDLPTPVTNAKKPMRFCRIGHPHPGPLPQAGEGEEMITLARLRERVLSVSEAGEGRAAVRSLQDTEMTVEPMILTPIPPDALASVLARYAASLPQAGLARTVFTRIAASGERADGDSAHWSRQARGADRTIRHGAARRGAAGRILLGRASRPDPVRTRRADPRGGAFPAGQPSPPVSAGFSAWAPDRRPGGSPKPTRRAAWAMPSARSRSNWPRCSACCGRSSWVSPGSWPSRNRTGWKAPAGRAPLHFWLSDWVGSPISA